MRTIRWRNGQCPGRNGQWAERIAHAGSEAVRLVPFSSLPAVILDYLRREYLVSAWRLPLCRDAVRITISIELVANFSAFRRDRATPCRARVLLGRSICARRPRAELCFRRRPRGARGAAARVVRSSDSCTHAGGLRWSQVQNLERRGCRSEHGRRGRLEDCQEHCRSISRSVRTVQGRIDALRVRRALSLRDISLVADIKLSILRECERT